jgi:hypothetical protein
MIAEQRTKERERVAKNREALETADGERTSDMCVEIRDFQAKVGRRCRLKAVFASTEPDMVGVFGLLPACDALAL